MHAPCEQHLSAVKRILRYLNGTLDYGLVLSKKELPFQLLAFADVDWASIVDDRRSISGNCVYLVGNIITWSSKKQKTVSRSTTEAEYRSLVDASSDATWVATLLDSMGIKLQGTPVIWSDNSSVISMSANPIYHSKTKHVELDVYFVREKVAANKLKINYVPSSNQIVDGFTKALSKDYFHTFRQRLGVISLKEVEDGRSTVIAVKQLLILVYKELLSFIKVIVGSSSEIRPTLINESNRSLILTMGLSLGSVASLSFMMALCSFLLYRHRVKSYEKLSENTSRVLTEQFTLRSFTFNKLDEATHCFDDELGRGSFGAVYKGILPGDGKSIVVKRLPKVNEGETDRIRTEMIVIGRTNHRNLVRLLGFCVEDSKKLLVYEYLSNGSLADFLFNMNGRPVWKERTRIALDMAKGILYLHEECEACIIHCNLKPHNILLDDSLTAKISDFGFAKLLRPNHARSTTGTNGTEWYSAPERQSSASVSKKVDIYSFGVILLEIICCRSNIEVQVCSADEILLSTWVYNCFVGGELNKLVEGEEEVDMRMVEMFVKVGLWCIQDDPTLRPLMKSVTLMLEGTMNVPIPPSPSLPLLLLS
ncbi:G-type lectin S-receptor-like serine/threonine-protein kinase LECRK1 [Hibiscus syriacus]|uniref:G-type lectin S-receptor-like serine/threonine-protein kinase LECRK1 n=1 Tax=Hibiscus syriacus TaxID=106335 RepID=UPI00192411AF|nr:G-type lectin S-receptor-like serine/threonine-protein kinase LECRK1 [Hibiscus syriacus]